ncbi:MAG TPA: transcription antitermination factor NusB [Actinomycetota bacterium]|nr:transcription antitermination factor NusB [Actinomycetota bacterium]
MSRHTARLAAVEVLYAADVRGADPAELLAERPRVASYAVRLIEAITARREEIDSILSAKSIGWPMQRMSPVDRNVLRIGVLELLEGDIPPAVIIDEAVELAKRFSGEPAGRFVNGILAAVLADRQEPGVAPEPSPAPGSGS